VASRGRPENDWSATARSVIRNNDSERRIRDDGGAEHCEHILLGHRGTFVAYFRVSADREGKSGFGLEAQRQAVLQFLDRSVVASRRVH
jgi:hypothetical protein